MTAHEWNNKYPVGTPVVYHAVIGDSDCVSAVTRSYAWELGSGSPVVMITGRSGGVSLRALDVQPDTVDKP